MPGPGAHMVYALGTGVGLMHASSNRFSAQHCLVYAVNAFLGPDLGSFAEWLTSSALEFGSGLGSLTMEFVHHPFYYVLLLGGPLAVLYGWLSRALLRKGLLDAGPAGVGLSRMQCLLLVAAGSFTHFFLDHLFEENGKSSTYRWILSTGWWEDTAPLYPYAVIVVGLLCTLLLAGFIYINRVRPEKSVHDRSMKSALLILIFVFLYCLWCTSQIYWRRPPQPAVGEEADLGVLVFLSVYFFLPHCLCLFSMNPKDHNYESSSHLPL